MKKLLDNLINDDGSVNWYGRLMLLILEWIPFALIFLIRGSFDSIATWILWGTCAVSLFSTKILLNREKPFYRWSKDGIGKQHVSLKRYVLDLLFFGTSHYGVERATRISENVMQDKQTPKD